MSRFGPVKNIALAVVAGGILAGLPFAANAASPTTLVDSGGSPVAGSAGDSTWSGSGSGTLISIGKYSAAKLAAIQTQLPGTLNIDGGLPSHISNWPSSFNVTLIGSTFFAPAPSGQQQTGLTAIVPTIASGCGILYAVPTNAFSISVYSSVSGYIQVLDTATALADGTAIPSTGVSFVMAPVAIAAGTTWFSPPVAYPWATNVGLVVCVSTTPATKTAVSGTQIITGQAL